MSHPINDALNRLEKRKQIECSNKCKYYKFDHLPCACVLSDVYSVNKGESCMEPNNLPSESSVKMSVGKNKTVIILDFNIHPKDRFALIDHIFDYCRTKLAVTENFNKKFNEDLEEIRQKKNKEPKTQPTTEKSMPCGLVGCGSNKDNHCTSTDKYYNLCK